MAKRILIENLELAYDGEIPDDVQVIVSDKMGSIKAYLGKSDIKMLIAELQRIHAKMV